MIARADLGAKGNKARRKFWELCASRAPEVHHITATGVVRIETPRQVAEWADRMLEEWDARWITTREPEENEEDRAARAEVQSFLRGEASS